MKEFQKELSKRAKNKNDSTFDLPRLVGYTKFHARLEEVLFPEIDKWMYLSLSEFGDWLGMHLRNDVTIEGSVLYQEKKFAVIADDEGQSRMVYTPEFVSMLQLVLNDVLDERVIRIFDYLTSKKDESARTNYNLMRRWLEKPTLVDSDLVMTHFVKKAFGR
jgi:hypothetical protein